MTRAVATTIIALVVVAAMGMLLTTQASAVRVVGEHDDVIVCTRTSPGTQVTITFTHSMYGGDVSETWAVAGDELQRIQIVTDNAAAAEYYAWDGQVERLDDRFLVVTPPLNQETLVFRVDQVGRHRLAIGTATYDLAAIVDGSAQVRIEPVSGPIWQGSPC